MMLLMRGLAKLSQAVVETQSTTMRSATGKFSIYLFTSYMLKNSVVSSVANVWTHCHVKEVSAVEATVLYISDIIS